MVPKTVLWTFLHPVLCCMGLIGVKSITFSGNKLLATSFVVLVLKGTNSVTVLQVICTFSKFVFGTKNSFLDFFRFLYIAAWDYIFGIESITFIGSHRPKL